MTKNLTVITLLLLVSLFFSNSCPAGWQGEIRANQEAVINYLYALMESPQTPRPRLYPAKGWKAKRALDEMQKAMARAERLANVGRGNQIQVPVFKFGPDDSGW